MKTIICLLCLLFSVAVQLKAQANTDSIIHINHLPPGGMVLNKGWKYQAGDNPEYASLSFNDSNWQPIDPTKDLRKILALWNNNIIWFRLHFTVENGVAKEHLAALIAQTGASEVYLNGQQIGKFGTIASDPKQVNAVSPPQGSFIPFPLNQSNDQILAVRFAVQKGIFYFNFAGRRNPALVLQVTDLNSISNNIHADKVVYFDFTRLGLFLILAVMHLALFFFNPSQKANLYFFIYAFLNCITSLFIGIVYWEIYHVSTKMLMLTVTMLFANISSLFLLLALYKVFHYKIRWIFWLLAATVIPNVFLFGTSEQSSFWLSNIFIFLPALEMVWVTIIALKEGQRGAKIVITGAISFVLFWILFVLFAVGYIPAGPHWTYGNFAFNISNLSIPIAISVYLALESSYTSRTLTQKLEEVQELSDLTRAQAQEKQQILATEKERLEQQVKERTTELKQSLDHLKATQVQLIQSEKMASLGELTAGIAHEIQNPLNFVNNFSDLNTELIEDLKAELATGNGQEAIAIADDIKENEQKINLHGKRADAIVKGMLQHSRASSGKKEPTDINALADEYLRLSHHGFRAKDKSFNATIETNFDESIGKVEVVPQDIGRVLLNLYNNAFYTVGERRRVEGVGYEPIVSVTTKREADNVIISVKDNGTGIPQKAVDKIFQPFFTTKPTGQGTGLGLSLSYDIVKANGGELRVKTKEGEGSEFVIELPI